MTDIYSLLGIDSQAGYEQIQAAYNGRRADLLAQEDTDPSVSVKLTELEEAFARLTSGKQLAPVGVPQVKIQDNPILDMVNSLDAPLQGLPGAVTYQACPFCQTPNPVQATLCANCGRQLSRPCSNCSHRVMLWETVCPRCGTVLRDLDQQRFAEGVFTKERVQDERIDNKVRVEAIEAGHRKNAALGVLLYILAFFLIIGICGLTILFVL